MKVTVTYRTMHQGTLLTACDPRAWENTMAFPDGTPTKREVTTHLRKIEQMRTDVEKHHPFYERERRIPILWDFGKVYWEDASKVMVVR